MWVKEELGAQQVQHTADLQTAEESLWCEMKFEENDKLLVGSVYRSPNSSIENNALINKLFDNMANGKSHVMIVEEFNYPEIDWIEGIAPKDPKYEASHFIETVHDSFLVCYTKGDKLRELGDTQTILDKIKESNIHQAWTTFK